MSNTKEKSIDGFRDILCSKSPLEGRRHKYEIMPGQEGHKYKTKKMKCAFCEDVKGMVY